MFSLVEASQNHVIHRELEYDRETPKQVYTHTECCWISVIDDIAPIRPTHRSCVGECAGIFVDRSNTLFMFFSDIDAQIGVALLDLLCHVRHSTLR